MILNTQEISSELKKVLSTANEFIYLVSPYLKFNKLIKESIQLASKRKNLKINIITKSYPPEHEDVKWLEKLVNVEVKVKENLHAKCYLNENRAIITSMNLYEFSQQNNFELGILLIKNENEEHFNILNKEISDLYTLSNSVYQVKLSSQSTYKEIQEKFLIDILSDAFDFEPDVRQVLKVDELDKIIQAAIRDQYSVKEVLYKLKLYSYNQSVSWAVKEFYKYEICKAINAQPKSEKSQYDQVELYCFKENKIGIFNTKNILPEKERILACIINENWMNDYKYL